MLTGTKRSVELYSSLNPLPAGQHPFLSLSQLLEIKLKIKSHHEPFSFIQLRNVPTLWQHSDTSTAIFKCGSAYIKNPFSSAILRLNMYCVLAIYCCCPAVDFLKYRRYF